MKVETVFWIFIALIVLDFIKDFWLDYLNAQHFDDPVPEELQDVYDSESYRKSIEYKKALHKFGFYKSFFYLFVILLFLFMNGFAWLDQTVSEFTQSAVWQSILFFMFLLVAESIISLPFSYYSVFKIEEKFGFNRMTLKTFVTDKIKSLFLSLIFLLIIGYPVIWIYYRFPDKFWWLAWLVVAGFSIVLNFLYSDLIVPLFNKQTPLEEGELRDRLEELARKAGFKLKNIYVIDGSKRSTKANAYFSGFGPRKRIVLYDTLIEDLEPEEIAAVLAHEIGHYKKKHIVWQMLISIVVSGLTFYLLSLALKSETLAQALGVDKPSFHIGAIAFALLYGLIDEILSLGQLDLSRKFEYQADRFAASFGYAGKLITSLKKLARKSFSNLTPHPLYVFFHYSHPPLISRIKHLKNEK